MSESQLQTITDHMLTEAAVTLSISSAFINSALGHVNRHARHAHPADLGRLRRESAWLSSLAQQLEDALAHAGAPQRPAIALQPEEAF